MSGQKTIVLAEGRRDSSFYEPIDLLVTIKSFDLRAVRARYLKSRKENKAGRAGSVERRAPSLGGVARVRLEAGRCDADLLGRMTEPRGIDVAGPGLAALAAENRVHLLTAAGEKQIDHPWFAYLHTAALSADGRRVAVSSSGFDALFEFETETGRSTWSWFAWENGFERATDPVTGQRFTLTRDPRRAEVLKKENKPFLLVPDPPDEPIPTARRAAFINSVAYDGVAGFLGTFFHEGAVYAIERERGKVARLLGGLRNPHGGRDDGDGTLLATSTAGGEIVRMRRATRARVHWTFAGLPGKPPDLGEREWVQNACRAGRFYVAIDANRTAFVIVDPDRGRYDLLPFHPDWAIQDMVPAEHDEAVDGWLRALGES